MVTAATASTNPQEDTMPTTKLERVPDPQATAAPTAPAPEASVPEADASPAPVDVDQVRAAAIAQERAYQKEVRELCRLAGRQELADAFIDRQVSVDQVRGALLEERAKADEALGVTSTVERPADQPGAQTMDLTAIYARRNSFHRAAVTGSAGS